MPNREQAGTMVANKPAKRASVTDVAREAGVSVGTVSNVLNRPERVTEPTRLRVENAVKKLNFVRNASARQLRSGDISTIGVVVLDIANPFFTQMARGIEDRLAEDDYTLMLCSSDEDPAREERSMRLFAEHGVSGVIATPSHSSMDLLLDLRRRGIEPVLLDYPSPLPELSSVSVDDVAGASLAMEHLLETGHEKIAFLNGPLNLRQCVDRRDGVLTTLLGRDLDPATVLTEVPLEALNEDAARAAMLDLLDAGLEATALFCANDFAALGALRALSARGLRVPEDVAIVGYDDVSFASMLATPLTSVQQPMREMGAKAADLLLAKLHGKAEAEQVEFAPKLVVRASSDARA